MIDVIDILKNTKRASYALCVYDEKQKNSMLLSIASALAEAENVEAILKGNAEDVISARANGKDDTFIDRLTLTPSRFENMIDGLKQIAGLPDPVGETVEQRTLAN